MPPLLYLTKQTPLDLGMPRHSMAQTYYKSPPKKKRPQNGPVAQWHGGKSLP